MKLDNTPIGTIKFKYRRSSKLITIVVITAVVLSIAALLMLTLAILDARQEVEDLRRQAADLQIENNQLQQDIEQLGTVQSIIKIAMEKLGLIQPDAIIIKPNH